MLFSDGTLSTTTSPRVMISLISWNLLRTLLMRLGFPLLGSRALRGGGELVQRKTFDDLKRRSYDKNDFSMKVESKIALT